jgi:hypothetical protein
MVTVAEAVIAPVEIVNQAFLSHAGTVTLAGTAATAGSLLESSITAPTAGASALRINSPFAVAPAVTLLGYTLKDEGVSRALTRN